MGLSVRGMRWQRKSVAAPSASNSCGSRTTSTNCLTRKPFERSARTVDQPFDSNWCRKGPTRLARKWGIERSLVRRSIVRSSHEEGQDAASTGTSQTPARTVQFRLVPWQNFVEAGAIFSDALFVALLDDDLPVPLHPVQVIEHRK